MPTRGVGGQQPAHRGSGSTLAESTHPSSQAAEEGGLAPTLPQEIARVFRHLGVQSLRASVVDLLSRDPQATWSIDDFGTVTAGDAARPLDSIFPAGTATVEQLEQAAEDATVMRKLSPRRWIFAWRLEGEGAIVGEAQFNERRDAVSEADAELIRLVCSTRFRGAELSAAPAGAASIELVWPQVDRRGRASAPRSAWLPVALLGATALLAAWLALFAAPAARELVKGHQAEVVQRRAMADATLVHGLSLALAGGDYGDVQSSLSAFAALGYFRSAAVLNANERVVALAGPAEGVRVGEKLVPRVAGAARALALKSGSAQNGQLLLLSEAAAAGAGMQAGALLVVALMTLAAALGAAGVFAWRLRRPTR